jgi:ribosomal protein S18 acetylase RimI-like enzyme
VGRPVGRHRLGPHVVGQRVVVRHLLPDGRATDVLGTCTAWDGDVAVVESEHGPVEIRVADIVTGKPVPPRASVRARVPARDAERHGLVLFPGLETAPLGEWLLRSDPAPGERLFKRANSCLAMGQPGVPFPDAERAVRDFYGARERPALVQIEQDTMTEHSFRTAGWTPIPGGDTQFQVASTAGVARALPAPPDGARVTEDGPRVLVEVVDDDAVVARGRAALDGDWLGLHGLATAPPYRRRGLARAVLAELLDWGAVQGATTLWLHVETGNAPALALYDALGFRTHHSCRYLTT